MLDSIHFFQTSTFLHQYVQFNNMFFNFNIHVLVKERNPHNVEVIVFERTVSGEMR